MTTTNSAAPAVYAAIASVLRDIGEQGISKDRKNAAQGYNFRGIDDAMNALNPWFAKHQLVIVPHYVTRTCTEREARGGGALICVVVEGTFDLVSAVDGSSVTVGPFWGESFDSGDKASNKAQSAALKYCLLQTFLVPVEVEDADATTHEVAPPAKAPTSAARPPQAPQAPRAAAPAPVTTPAKPSAPKAAQAAPAAKSAKDTREGTWVRGAEVKRVWVKDGKRDDGSGWRKFDVVFLLDDGKEYRASTFDTAHGERAQQAEQTGERVNLKLAPSARDPKYTDLLDVEIVLETPEPPAPPIADAERVPDDDDIPFAWLVPFVLPLTTAALLGGFLA